MWRMIAGIFVILLGLQCSLGRSIHASYDKLSHNATIQATGKIFTYCGNTADDNTRVQVNDLTVKPSPPRKGEKLTIIVDLKMLEDVTSGEVKVNLNYGNIPIIDETLDLCNLISQIDKSCPLKKNKDVKFTSQRDLPDYVPSGKYTGKGIITDQNGMELVCFELKFSL